MQAEDELESARERISELEGLLRSMVRATADPMLLKVIGECVGLLNEALSLGGSVDETWRTRVAAQLHVINVMRQVAER